MFVKEKYSTTIYITTGWFSVFFWHELRLTPCYYSKAICRSEAALKMMEEVFKSMRKSVKFTRNPQFPM